MFRYYPVCMHDVGDCNMWKSATRSPGNARECHSAWKVSDLYSTKVSEENQGALGMGARGRDRPTESNRSLSDV